MNSEPLDLIPLWCFFLMTMVIGVLSVEVGYRVGKSRHARSSDEKDASVAAMVGSILGLLACMLAFTLYGGNPLRGTMSSRRGCREGLLHVNQQPMINLYDTTQAAKK